MKNKNEIIMNDAPKVKLLMEAQYQKVSRNKEKKSENVKRKIRPGQLAAATKKINSMFVRTMCAGTRRLNLSAAQGQF